MKNLGAEKIVFLIVGGLTALVLILIVVFSLNEQKQVRENANITSYSATDSERPKVKVDSKFSDLGKMKVSEEKSAEFVIENTGNKPLILSQISSSCMCTFGQVEFNGNKSPEFGMHSKSDWTETVEPGKRANLSVIYKPSLMPVSGIITRDVYVQTNDPDNLKLTFTIKADVE